METTSTSLIPLRKIQEARLVLKDVIKPTPLEYNRSLSRQYGANVYLKREDLQVVRSFKIRGAYYKMSQLTKEEVSKARCGDGLC